MNYIQRDLEKQVLTYLKPNKAVVILGARRTGKTKLIHKIIEKLNEPCLHLNGDDIETHELLARRSHSNYNKMLGNIKLLIIDESQEIPDIGMKTKLMLDTIEGLKILLTGSSALEINNQIGEPLVGRKMTFNMYAFAQTELDIMENAVKTQAELENRLIYGTYPDVVLAHTPQEKSMYLKEQINAYLLKDILAHEGIQKREKIVQLLRMIAFRVGSEISIEGIGNELGISKNTVDRYLDLLSKVFIIHRVGGFSRNLDNEITKRAKWYFLDNGIRNALISNFSPLSQRDDHGQLWENYLISERLKQQTYQNGYSLNYFWRTHARQEIDWIEDYDGQLHAYEFKWSKTDKAKIPITWKKAYPDAQTTIISRENYLDFIRSPR